MIRISIAMIAVASVAACGGSRYSSSNAKSSNAYRPVAASAGTFSAPALFARGPLQKACQASDRKARSRSRCGCIQAVADQSLSSADQRRGSKYWKNPGKLQEVRQSDNPSNERFWKAWKAFGQSAAAQCRDS